MSLASQRVGAWRVLSRPGGCNRLRRSHAGRSNVRRNLGMAVSKRLRQNRRLRPTALENWTLGRARPLGAPITHSRAARRSAPTPGSPGRLLAEASAQAGQSPKQKRRRTRDAGGRRQAERAHQRAMIVRQIEPEARACWIGFETNESRERTERELCRYSNELSDKLD